VSNKYHKCLCILLAFSALFFLGQTIQAQTSPANAEEYTGSIISFNGPRTRTAFFTLRINRQTSTEQARRFLTTLREDGQDRLLSAVRNEDLGSFSVGNGLARTVNVVRETQVDGRRRIFVVFERWTQFAEARGGYRSLDYPFGVVELFIDEKTGKGEGTYIAAARISWDEDGETNQGRVEIENFGTYPAKLTAVSRSGRQQRRP
jgi:hypothetical protein